MEIAVLEKEIDILCVGEVLIDFIGHQIGAKISETRDYHRYLGGSPTNVAMNMCRLGSKSALVASTGTDGLSDYIFSRLNEVGVNIENVVKHKDIPTSVILVSKTSGTPDFIPYRSADAIIVSSQIPAGLLKRSRIFHTTCFALSKEPARSVILQKAGEAMKCGCKLSIDVNYADELWDSKKVALDAISTYCAYNPLVKISEDDMFRLFGKHLPHHEIFEFFTNLGVSTICLTLGGEGVKLFNKSDGIIEKPAIKLDKIEDATGAGDAFWSGFLFAYLKESSWDKCLDDALKVAAFKLQNVGRLPNNINILSSLL